MNSFAGSVNYTIGFKALFIMVVLSAVLQRFFGDLIEIFLGSSPETPPLRFHRDTWATRRRQRTK